MNGEPFSASHTEAVEATMRFDLRSKCVWAFDCEGELIAPLWASGVVLIEPSTDVVRPADLDVAGELGMHDAINKTRRR